MTVCTVVKSKVEISQNFVAFSEYMNFTKQEGLKIRGGGASINRRPFEGEAFAYFPSKIWGEGCNNTPLLPPSSDGPFVCTALKFVALDDMRRMKEPNLSTIGRQNKFPVKSFTRCTIYNFVINHNNTH